MKCANCGAELPEGMNICDKCGTAVVSVQNSEAVVKQPKKGSPLKKVVIGIIIVLVILLIVGLASGGDDDSDNNEAPSAEQTTEQDNGAISPDDFTEYDMKEVFEAFENNSLGASQKYSGTLIKGKVKVDGVAETEIFVNIDEPGAAVYISSSDHEGVWANYQGIGAIATEYALDKAYELNPGDIVTVYLEYIGTDALERPEFYLYYIE